MMANVCISEQCYYYLTPLVWFFTAVQLLLTHLGIFECILCHQSASPHYELLVHCKLFKWNCNHIDLYSR